MEELKKLLAESGKCDGIPLDSLNDAAIKQMAKALDIEAPRTVTLKEQYGGVYAQIPRIPYTDGEGERKYTRHFSIRAEAIDQLIADLEEAKGLLDS